MKKIDSLNGEMYTSDVFQILFDYEVSRCKRYPSPLTLIQLEMTPTAISTEALSAAAGIFSSALNVHLRAVDIPSKKGNIFTLLLPNSDKHGAHAVCERLLSVFRKKFETPAGESIVFSIYIGATTHDGGPTITSTSVVQKAEEARKQSKLKGSNTFVFLS
jgi:hypothetical protein